MTTTETLARALAKAIGSRYSGSQAWYDYIATGQATALAAEGWELRRIEPTYLDHRASDCSPLLCGHPVPIERAAK